MRDLPWQRKEHDPRDLPIAIPPAELSDPARCVQPLNAMLVKRFDVPAR